MFGIIKKYAAILIAAAFVFSMIPPLAASADGEPTLDEVLNVQGGGISFTTDGDFPFVPAEDGGRSYAEAETGSPTGVSSLRFSVYMEQNAVLRFEYSGSFDPAHTGFAVYVNGEEPEVNSAADICFSGWASWAYSAQKSGSYSFELQLGRFEAAGNALIRVDNVELVAQPADLNAAEVLNTAAGFSYYTAGTHGYTSGSEGGRSYIKSANTGANTFFSLFTFGIDLQMGDEIKFDYCVSHCSQGDEYLFRVGQSTYRIYGNQADGAWHTYTYTAMQTERRELELTFLKRSSGSSGSLKLANFRFTPYHAVTLEEALNVPGGRLHFSTDPQSPFIPYNLGGRAYALGEGDEGWVETTAYMHMNEALRFETAFNFSYFGEQFVFTVDGEEERAFTNLDDAGGDGYISHVYVASEAGYHTFRWTVRSSLSGVMLDNVELLADPNDSALGAALNAGGSIGFMTYGSHGFLAEDHEGASVARSDNLMGMYTRSVLATEYVELAGGSAIRFKYSVQGAEPRDYFEFRANGERIIFTPTASNGGGEYSFVWEIPATGLWRFEWSFWRGALAAGPTFVRLDDIELVDSAPAGPTLDEALNVPGGSLSFSSEGTNRFEPMELFGRAFATSGVTGENWPHPIMGVTVDMRRNDVLSFDFQDILYSYYYGFEFTINGEVQYIMGDSADVCDWESFVFIAPEDGTYALSWKYVRGTSSYGEAVPMEGRVDNVRIGRSYDPALAEALNESGGLAFICSGKSRFVPENGALVLRGTDERCTMHSCWAEMQAGDALSFEYETSGFGSGCTLRLIVNDTIALTVNNSTNGRRTYSYTAQQDGAYRFRWIAKLSGGSGDAFVLLDGLVFTGEADPGPLMGDANGDGVVDLTDALLVLRRSMGLIPSLACPEAADMNGDGAINVQDALMILRRSMGLI